MIRHTHGRRLANSRLQQVSGTDPMKSPTGEEDMGLGQAVLGSWDYHSK